MLVTEQWYDWIFAMAYSFALVGSRFENRDSID